MGIRAFVPLPGPAVYVSRSRADKLIEREYRERRRAAMTSEERGRRALCLVVLAGLLFTSWAGHYFGTAAGVAAALVGAWVFVRCLAADRARRAAEADAADEAMAASIRDARTAEVAREL